MTLPQSQRKMGLWLLRSHKKKYTALTTRVVRYLSLVWLLCRLRFVPRHGVNMEQVLLHRRLHRGICSIAWRQQHRRSVAGYLDNGKSWPCGGWCIFRRNGQCVLSWSCYSLVEYMILLNSGHIPMIRAMLEPWQINPSMDHQ